MQLPPAGVGGRNASMCFLMRGLGHTWGPASSLAVALSRGSFTIISFHLEKFFGIIENNCSQAKARTGDNFWLLNSTNMCILYSWWANAGSLFYHCQRHSQSPPPAKHMAPPLGGPFIFSLLVQAALLPAAVYTDYCLFWHFFWKELFKKVRYTGSSTYSFLNRELSTLCLFLSPWIMSAP